MHKEPRTKTEDTNPFLNESLSMNDNTITTERNTKPKKKCRKQNCNSTYNSRYLSDYPDVLTPSECQNILLVGRNTIYSLLQNNIIKSIKIGKQYRIPKSSLQNYLNLCYSDEYIDNSASA